MKLLRWLPLLLAAVTLPTNTFAAGLILVHDPARPDQFLPSPEPLPRPFPRPRPLPPGFVLEMTSHRVEARIKEQYAITEIAQEFKNPTGRRLEGTFLFPVPRGAQLRKFTMEIDGKPVAAELLAADKARSIYEDIVRRQNDPALLEFVERDLYRVRIFPIEPHATRKVTFSYEQLLVADAGLVRYVYPLAVEKFSAKPIERVSLKIDLSAGRPLKSIYSPTHDVDITRQGEGRATVGYETAGAGETADFELFFSRDEEGVGMSLLTYRADDSQDGYFLLLASPGLVAEKDRVLPKDVVFVVDTSGSMAGGKLDQAKKALHFCVENLNAGDRFEVLRFATDLEPLFQDLVTVDDASRRKARDFITRLKPLGGTAIHDSLQAALKLRSDAGERPFIVIFLTDGLPTVGETNIDRIVTTATGGAQANTRIFCFGIGTDVNTHLLDRITEATRAASQYVLPNEDLEVKLSSFFAKIKDPVLTQPGLSLPAAARVSRMYPQALPDLFNGEQLVVVGRYASPADGTARLTGQAGGEEKNFAGDITFPKRAGEHDFIPRLWATRRIGWLLDEIRLRGENKELKDEVATLAREHGIVTPYTAWLIVEDEQRRGVRPENQTLRETSANRDALRFSEENYTNLGRSQSGVEATLGAAYGGRARLAQRVAPAGAAPDVAVQDERFTSRYGGGGGAVRSHTSVIASSAGGGTPAQPPQLTPSQLAQQTQSIAGKTFFQNGAQWIDAEVQKHPDARRVVVAFGSPEYFALLHRGATVAKWAAIGTQVQFVFEGVIYEVTAPTP